MMFSRNLFLLDFVRRFFVSCAQISEAYTTRTPQKSGCDWRKISHKSKYMKDSERTSNYRPSCSIFSNSSTGTGGENQYP